MEKFVHLHLHTQYSLLDGAAVIDKLVKVLEQRGATACAMTDHGNMYGAIKFYKACKKHNIKPIIGTEFYVAKNYKEKTGKFDYAHLILLAKNEQGYKNLVKLNSIAWVDGFYYKPRIDYDLLEQHSEGLICSSACLAGDVQRYLVNGEFDKAEQIAIRLRDMFAPGDFYIEVMDHGIPEQRQILQAQFDLAKKIGVKTIATNDVHYIYPEDAEMQDIMMCIATGKTIDDPDRMRMEGNQFYLKTEEEMRRIFAAHPEAIDNTLEVAEKVNFDIDFKSQYYPKFTAPDGMTNSDYLRKITEEGLIKCYGKITPEIKERWDFEMNTLEKSGYVDYYLVVWDFINFSKQNDVPVGPGRGSGAASIIAYAIGITDIDPLKYELYFERFLNPERVSPPDFDIDFCPQNRYKVIDYVTQKYGAGNVSQIITFGTLAAKAAIKDVARVLKMPYSDVDKITKAFPTPTKMPKSPAIKKLFGVHLDENDDHDHIVPELHEMYENDPLVQKIVDVAIKLENMPRNTSIHAAGVIICCDEISDHCPLAKNGEMVTSQYDKGEIEEIGLLKMDFLGLITLTDINLCLKLIKETHGIDVDFSKMEYNDPAVYDLISSGDTDMIFQVESGGFAKLLKDVRPVQLEDIIGAVALYRPGPMDSIPEYLQNRKDPSSIVYEDERLKPILDVTNGVMVYQEQVMKICQVIAGYTMGQADGVRKIMGKKLLDKLPAEKEKFINGWVDPEGKKSIAGAIKLGMKKETAEKLWNKMEKFGRYAFNKAHSAAYAVITYQTAWLKKYYPVELYAAILNNRITKSDEITHYIELARAHNIQVLPPDINKSMAYFSVEGNNLRFGLGGLKNVGVAVVEEIVKERQKNGNFTDLQDFISRMGSQAHNKRFLESMIWGGAFDVFGAKRSQMIAIYEKIVERVNSDRKHQAEGQMTLFDNMLKEDKSLNKIELPNIPEYSDQQKLKFEKTVLGVYISGHPLDQFRDQLRSFGFSSDMLIGRTVENNEGEEEEVIYDNVSDGQVVNCGGIINNIKKMNTKNGNRDMAIVTIEDLFGTFDVMVFPNLYDTYKSILKEDSLVKLKGKISIREGEKPIILLEEMETWNVKTENKTEQKQQEKQQKLYLKFSTEDKQTMDLVVDILKTYSGKLPVAVQCSTHNKLYSLPYKVDGSSALLNELYAVLSENCIKLI